MGVTAAHAGNGKVDGGRPLPTGGPGISDVKFAVPLVTHLVPRPRLHALMTTSLECFCTLVAAPAGWGKTLLASSWLAAGGAGRATAWISLGPAEDDVRALWAAIATAIAPIVGERSAAGLHRSVIDEDVEQLPGQVAAHV